MTPDPDEPRHPGFGDSQQIVVLGHPSAVSSEAIAAQADALVSALADGDVPFVRWRDQWRTTTASRSGLQSLGSKPHLFIQPSGPGEAGDLAGNRKLLRRWIESSLAADGRVDDGKPGDWKPVVWLPDGFDDEAFQVLLKAAADDADLTLRNDSALALAHWIRAQRQGNAPTQSVPVLTLEEVDANDAGRLREALHASFYDIVGQVVQPKPELWRFEGEMLVEQIKQMDTDRAIVAVHDLNTGTARGQREARFQLEQKLGPIAAEVDRAVRASGRKLKLFYSAMLVQKAEQLPWVKYPSPSQFENWCLLPFASSPAAAAARPVVQPKEGPLKIFRNYLRDWNDNRQAA